MTGLLHLAPPLAAHTASFCCFLFNTHTLTRRVAASHTLSFRFVCLVLFDTHAIRSQFRTFAMCMYPRMLVSKVDSMSASVISVMEVR